MPSAPTRFGTATAALVLGSALLGSSVGPPVAHASAVAVEDGVVVYVADPGEVNETFIYRAYGPQYQTEFPDSVYVSTSDQVTPGAGCALAVDASFPPFVTAAYLCSGVTDGVHAELGDGNDFLIAEAPNNKPVQVDAGEGDDWVGLFDSDDTIIGGPGDDELLGGHGNDMIDGGDGNDQIDGDYGGHAEGDEAGEDLEGAGSDTLSGGDGNDRLQGNGGADLLSGGAGQDIVLYSAREEAVTVSFDGQGNDGQAAEKDTVGLDVEAVTTGFGDDTITGGPGAETISSGRGNDVVDPGGGLDIIDAGPGTDTVRARDGVEDTVGCGDGADSATLDAADIAGSDCEQQDRPAGAQPQPPSRLTPVRIQLRAARAGQRLRVSGRVLLPTGSDTRVCAGAKIQLRVLVANKRRQRRTTATAIAGADCSFRASPRLTLRRGSRVTVRGSMPATSFLDSATSESLRLKVRR